jgi:hypothetical protein
MLVIPIADWEDGNLATFLRALPALTAFIANGYKPQVLLSLLAIFAPSSLKSDCNSLLIADHTGVFNDSLPYESVR